VDAGATEGEDGLINGCAAGIAHRHPPKAFEPGEGTLDDPAVAAQSPAGVDAD
jgi:hypothetical protein